MSAISSFATSKRSSCDRCRKQKLRCPSNDNTQACGRCLRAGTPCVTSYTRPKGRSQKHSISSDSKLYASGSDKHLMHKTTLPNLESILPISSGSTAPAPAEETNGQPWSLLEEYGLLPSFPEHDSGNTLQGQDENLAGLWCSSVYKELDSDMHVDPPGTSQDAYPADFPTCLHDSRERYSAEMLQQVESDMRLSELNLELCRQLNSHLRPSTAKSDDALVQQPPSSTAFRSILQNTETYIQILHCLSSRTGLRPENRCQAIATTENGHDSVAAVASCPNPSLLCVLSITSCFFRIVDLFNILLSNLALELTTHSLSRPRSASLSAAAISSHRQILPELNLAGLPVHEASLQIKILVLAITHHFETMERLLGMPVELRVSERGEDDVQGLLSASWTGMLSSGTREGCDLGLFETENWVKSVGSLRANIGWLTRVY